MTGPFEDERPAHLQDLPEFLRENRPALSPTALDRVKRRALAGSGTRGGAPQHRTKGSPMRTRLAIISALALGVLMSSTGTLLAFTSSSGSGDASRAVYVQGDAGTPTPNTPAPGPNVLGDEAVDTGQNPTDDTLPSTERPTTLQVAEQKAAGETETLPLTGLAAIPIVVVGLLLIAFGLFLRSRVDSSHQAA